MSWDNNNLACILVFPPWQKKGLGKLLMGISYAIAKREGIMGGPEKPISELGMKGYTKFWGGEIAMWILGQGVAKKGKGALVEASGEGEVTVESISRDTWIAKEDVLAVMREMGIVEKVLREEGEQVERVRIDKEAVRRWCESKRVPLRQAIDEEGFVEGYAIPFGKEGEGEEESDD